MPGGIDCIARELRSLCSGLRCVPLPPWPVPRFRGDFVIWLVVIFGRRVSTSHVAQVGLWVDAAAAAALDEGVDNGAVLAGLARR